MPGTKRFQFVIETQDPGKWEVRHFLHVGLLPANHSEVKSLNQDMNKADAEQIVRLLGQCDAEIFQEEGQVMPTYQSTLTTMEQVAEKVQKVGGGTSGRMAFLMSTSFLPVLVGFNPLSMAREGRANIALFTKSQTVGWLVGFCFVYLVVVLGRGTAEFFQRLFQLSDSRHQMQKLQEKQEAFVLNPAIGILLGVIITPQPEDLSDSFWMKGRSTTNILLEALLPAAHKTVDHCSVRTIGPLCLLEILQTFEQAYQVTYGQSPKITTLMKQASTRCPGEKGRVYLVGWQTLGIIAIMDGVECMHAFDFWAVHGFLIADRSSMFNQEVELINQGPHFSFSLEDFLTPILPSLTETDTVLFSFTLDDNLTEVQTLVEQVKEKISNIQRPGLSTQRRGAVPIPLKKLFPSIISITWPLLFFEYQGNFIQKVQHKLSTKWVLNTMSTGAHVLFAQILQNHMLDLLIHNFKLFCKANQSTGKKKILHAFLVSKVGAGQGSQGIYDPILATPVSSSPDIPSMMVREPPLGDPLPSATVG
ncbi:hypothetical protein FD754_001956 [Muntiacus muntjak]|uniref:Glucokinase regulatory protein second SIS domain-containing protein n=1 Tax=Muntiacus muntjak TaxID=9888 RepID=A0A5N3W7X2_MUNMU|nr:hypothetical protein FD754_001956 [Muntiacus muntjak]